MDFAGWYALVLSIILGLVGVIADEPTLLLVGACSAVAMLCGARAHRYAVGQASAGQD